MLTNGLKGDLIYLAVKLCVLRKKNPTQIPSSASVSNKSTGSVFFLPPSTWRVLRWGASQLRVVEWIFMSYICTKGQSTKHLAESRCKSNSKYQFESNKKHSVGLLQKWSILSQMTTLRRAPEEGSGPEVGVIEGLRLLVRHWRQMFLLHGQVWVSSDGERETWERSPVIPNGCNYLSSSF